MPPSILNSRKASSISLLVNFSPQVISEWRNISASIWPLSSPEQPQVPQQELASLLGSLPLLPQQGC